MFFDIMTKGFIYLSNLILSEIIVKLISIIWITITFEKKTFLSVKNFASEALSKIYEKISYKINS